MFVKGSVAKTRAAVQDRAKAATCIRQLIGIAGGRNALARATGVNASQLSDLCHRRRSQMHAPAFLALREFKRRAQRRLPEPERLLLAARFAAAFAPPVARPPAGGVIVLRDAWDDAAAVACELWNRGKRAAEALTGHRVQLAWDGVPPATWKGWRVPNLAVGIADGKAWGIQLPRQQSCSSLAAVLGAKGGETPVKSFRRVSR